MGTVYCALQGERSSILCTAGEGGSILFAVHHREKYTVHCSAIGYRRVCIACGQDSMQCTAVNAWGICNNVVAE